jgi:hypothetical protein
VVSKAEHTDRGAAFLLLVSQPLNCQLKTEM